MQTATEFVSACISSLQFWKDFIKNTPHTFMLSLKKYLFKNKLLLNIICFWYVNGPVCVCIQHYYRKSQSKWRRGMIVINVWIMMAVANCSLCIAGLQQLLHILSRYHFLTFLHSAQPFSSSPYIQIMYFIHNSLTLYLDSALRVWLVLNLLLFRKS